MTKPCNIINDKENNECLNQNVRSIPLAGDLSIDEDIARMIRVNQAGEYGAKRIYEGQISVLSNSEILPVINDMYKQELKHLEYFNNQIRSRENVRPTALQPLWHVAGWLLGASTALLGEKAAMACTVAVEEVIEEHYEKQLDRIKLYGVEKDLAEKIAIFKAEEVEHRDTGLKHEAELTPAYYVLTNFIKLASRTAIWLSERV